MLIGWYPGHMNKARKDIIKQIRQVDGILELVDARVPYSSANPMLNELIGDKPRLRVMTKADIACPSTSKLWLGYFKDHGINTIIASTNNKSTILDSLRHFRISSATRGTHKLFRLMVIGIPNVGKSTFINTLSDKKIARVGNEPAVTKKQQEILLTDNLAIVDTPGVLWPKIQNQDSAYRLAITGAIRNTAIEFDDIALYLLDYLRVNEAEILASRYQLQNPDLESLTLLESIGRKRGCLSKSGVDYTRAGEIVINDFRAGKLGNLSLETPELIRHEEALMAEEDSL